MSEFACTKSATRENKKSRPRRKISRMTPDFPSPTTETLIQISRMRRASFMSVLEAVNSQVHRARASSEQARVLRERAAAVSFALALTSTASRDVVEYSSRP